MLLPIINGERRAKEDFFKTFTPVPNIFPKILHVTLFCLQNIDDTLIKQQDGK